MIEPTSGTISDRSGGCAWTQTELEQLRVRVIALENLLIAVLAQGPQAQRVLARNMADYICPRPGHTPHPLTLRAAAEMRSLLDRATPFQAAPRA